MRIGLIGASGFIGLRTAEILHIGGIAEVRPVVRSAASLAVLARMNLDWRVCDPLNAETLAKALRGCSVCVHAAIGDSLQIVRMAAAAYDSCVRAGVSRLIWLSSASVHGQNPPIGTDETSPLSDRQPTAYNNAKVRAEWVLDQMGNDGRVEVVKLRPSVVYGPRSRWIADSALALLDRRAGWIDSGQGICNSIYVDNLVEAIRRSATASDIGGESFLVSDRETVRWRQILLPIAESFGFPEEAFNECPVRDTGCEHANGLASIMRLPLYAKGGSYIPKRAKRVIKALRNAWPQEPPVLSQWALPASHYPRLTPEMSQLQQCEWKLPNTKAERILSYRPPVSFNEGMSRSLAWLDFAGFPAGKARSAL